MELIEKTRSILSDAFPAPDRVDLWETGGISGSVVSERFEGVEMRDRINMIWDVIDRGLSHEERREILMIVPATPEEATAYSA